MLQAEGQDVLVHAAVEHVVAALHHVDAARLHALLHLPLGEVGDADKAGLALPHDLVERAHRLLERCGRVRPVDEQDVHVVRAEIEQALIDGGEDRLGAAVAALGPVAVADAALGDDEHVLAPPCERLAEEPLRLPSAVGGRGVEAVDPYVYGVVDRLGDLGSLDVAVAAPHLPAPEPEGRDFEARLSEGSIFHHRHLGVR